MPPRVIFDNSAILKTIRIRHPGPQVLRYELQDCFHV